MTIEQEAESEGPISLRLGEDAPISLKAFRAQRIAELKIGTRTCEIELGPGHVKSLRDQLPDVLTALEQAVDADAACEAAKSITGRTVLASEGARTLAMEAAEAGLDELAADAEAAVEWARICVYAVDAGVQTVREAARAADHATEIALRAHDKMEAELIRLRDPALADEQDSP